ncbi:MAG TPA: TPM domain-containing protein [Thermoanaerobaculia bacterium]|nr:TPM domain-containing protein [Thermoanaerobaculia bacterium]
MIIPQPPPLRPGPSWLRSPCRFRGRTWPAALLALLVLLLWSRFAEPASPRTVTVEQIPKPPAGAWTVDVTGTLPAAVRAEIDRIARAVREQGRGELAVVVIGSTGGTPHRSFATLLANVWGVGSAERDDGVLILAALDDRAIEIVLGLGLDSPAEIQISREIVDREMIPRFRAGDPAGGIRAGAEAVARRLFKADLRYGGSSGNAGGGGTW